MPNIRTHYINTFERVHAYMKAFLKKYYTWIYLFFAILITIQVLFIQPMPGVADQGDFQRIMIVTGLYEDENTIKNSEILFFRYVKNKYNMAPTNPLRLLGIIPTTSMIYPISLVKIICSVGASKIFNTEILAAVYATFYLASLFLCLKWLKIKKLSTIIVLTITSLFIVLDGNYLVWFNSLYGEPMMITGLLLFIASILNVSNKITINNADILFVVISSFLFLGSKIQCITSLPFFIVMIVKCFTLKYKNTSDMTFPLCIKTQHCSVRKGFSLTFTSAVLITTALIVFYTLGIYLQVNSTCGVDTKYNSVFYGILKNSKNPQRDLEMLGLSKDMAIEAGKHAYLPKDEYAKYVPWSDITQKEFNEKISNARIIRFYILNPDRLINGMKYTAAQSFQTSSFLGKYKITDVSEYTFSFKRFTIWSDLREKLFPKKLWFIIMFYSMIIIVTLMEYTDAYNKILKRTAGVKNNSIKLKIELIWLIAAIGIFQFPMPYLGNGEADTSKQLFLFNYTFDLLVLVSINYLIYHLLKITNKYLRLLSRPNFNR